MFNNQQTEINQHERKTNKISLPEMRQPNLLSKTHRFYMCYSWRGLLMAVFQFEFKNIETERAIKAMVAPTQEQLELKRILFLVKNGHWSPKLNRYGERSE